MKIAFFDSGIGGLTVFNEALHLFPHEDYIYFADSRNAPYGCRSEQEVEKLIIEAIDFLAKRDVGVLVLACHTASRLTANKLRRRYPFPIIGMHPGIEEVSIRDDFKKALICGTDLSIKVWKAQFGGNAQYLSLQNLIVFAENFEFNTPAVFDYLYAKLGHIDWHNYRSIVLGCTHFPFFKSHLREILPENIKILDGSLETVRQLGPFVGRTNSPKSYSIDYFISKTPKAASFFSKYLEQLNIIPHAAKFSA